MKRLISILSIAMLSCNATMIHASPLVVHEESAVIVQVRSGGSEFTDVYVLTLPGGDSDAFVKSVPFILLMDEIPSLANVYSRYGRALCDPYTGSMYTMPSRAGPEQFRI